MDPVLKGLIRYQEVSLELDHLNTLLDRFPVKIRSIDEELEAAAAALEKIRSKVAGSQKRRREREAELQDLESKLKKYNSQLMQVKTNTEYKAMQKEIGGVKESVGTVEEEILMLLEEADEAEKHIAEQERLHQGSEQQAVLRRNEIQKEKEKVDAEASRLESEKDTAQSALGQDVLDLFGRIAAIRNGVAVARASEERCQECKVRVRPQVFTEIKFNERIIQCDSCQRILYYLEQAPTAESTA